MGATTVAAATEGTISGLATIAAGEAANEALTAADMHAQIQKKANTAAVNAI